MKHVRDAAMVSKKASHTNGDFVNCLNKGPVQSGPEHSRKMHELVLLLHYYFQSLATCVFFLQLVNY